MVDTQQNIISNAIEGDYSKSVSLKHRKKFAQFFTPFPVANLMAKWILGNDNLKTVLDPAFGLGVFARALLSQNKNIKIKGFDIDEHIFYQALNLFEDYKNVSIHLQDYMFNDWNSKYDGIICNPPYFKFHDYDNKNVLKEIEINLNCKLNGFTNLYTLFLLKSIFQLSENGRAAYIIPSEFLNSDYGKLIKSYLIKSKTLRHIIVVDFKENVFDDAMTTASIILCANDKKSTQVCFSNVQSIKDLGKIEELINSYPVSKNSEQIFKFSDLNPEIKWKAYYQKQNSIKFKNLVPFSLYGKVVRGIATGANDYFTFNISKAKEHSIDEKYLLPCICKSINSQKAFFNISDYKKLRDDDKTVFLLNAINSNDVNVLKYLEKGKNEDIDKKFLTSRRNPWFSIENRPPAPIWVSVFNRKGLRFIRNEANISNLTTFHCIYPKQNSLFQSTDIDLLFAYLLTNTAKQIFADNSREYGNGLQKFEPNDLNKGKMLDIASLKENTKKEIIDLYNHYKVKVEKKQDGENYLCDIDKILIKNFT
ncbi:HsdM family class I SAM-dependent methyltransferase [Flavobacterium hibisci]|uniref:HsdM family class I SAM-dependent methyltransferase n=1 Tax=Flavobacterium hibisci TaxID=1914462 RepID=UPI001CBBFE7D|nr:Eco57I restriction-modification methylase domain-containing protein [Flavobacterium hibisci]MBZ4044042.1 Eco57I restriction-modification methylase domain-containing protein [Flavobacterium hibisci]